MQNRAWVLRSEHTAQEFVKIDEWTRPAGISRNGNIGPKNRLGNEPATYRATTKKSPDSRPGSADGGVPPVLPSVICVRDLRSFTPPLRGAPAEHLGPCLERSAMTFVMSAPS